MCNEWLTGIGIVACVFAVFSFLWWLFFFLEMVYRNDQNLKDLSTEICSGLTELNHRVDKLQLDQMMRASEKKKCRKKLMK